MSRVHTNCPVVLQAVLAAFVLAPLAGVGEPCDGSELSKPRRPASFTEAKHSVTKDAAHLPGDHVDASAALSSGSAGAMGACCGNDVYAARCFFLTPAECDRIGGAYRGDGTFCPADCPLCHNDPRPCDWCWEGTLAEGACPTDWEADGECDCGCQFDDAADCAIDTEPPFIVHERGAVGQTTPCSRLIDPRLESDNGVALNLGVDAATIVFSEPVRASGGGPIVPGSFTVKQTGVQAPPTVTAVQALSPTTYVAELSRPISLQEWTTIQALVEDEAGNPIADFGDLGVGIVEPDRVDIGFLPCDVNQDGVVTPQDLLNLRQFLTAGSYHNDCDDLLYFDIDRDGLMPEPQDLLRFRQMLEGTAPATRPWALEEMNAAQP